MAGDARIGKDDVKFAEILGECREEPLAIFRNGDVGAVAASVRPKFSDGFVQRLLVATGDGNLRAFSDEKSCCGQTDAAVTAGNKSLLACEFHTASFFARPAINYDARHTHYMMIIIDGGCRKNYALSRRGDRRKT